MGAASPKALFWNEPISSLDWHKMKQSDDICLYSKPTWTEDF